MVWTEFFAKAVAIASFLAAIGAFIDKYHMTSTRLERTREFLVALWLFLSEAKSLTLSSSNDKKKGNTDAETFEAMLLFVGVICGIIVGINLLPDFDFDRNFSGANAIPSVLQIFGAIFAGLFISQISLILIFWVLYAAVFTVRVVLWLLRSIGMTVLSTASAPHVLPFTYLGAVAGMIGSVANLILQLVK
ncbi:hypothetical protein PEC18_26070 [Paucibacter sp. O1-1]|nr:hypothetical protein [Paucibacter sp. O1-1]MDA3829208.1 hypothetical protein [Paucibacter sp. O1-1]